MFEQQLHDADIALLSCTEERCPDQGPTILHATPWGERANRHSVIQTPTVELGLELLEIHVAMKQCFERMKVVLGK